MEQLINKLVAHLERECNFLQSYLAVLKQQSTLVAAVEIDELNHNVGQLSRLAQQNDALSEDRNEIFEALSNRMNLPIEQVTISSMIESLDDPWREKLEQRKKNIIDVVNQIQYETRTNAFILNYAINFTHTLIQMQDKALKADSVYSKSGQKKERIPQNKMLNTKV